MRLSRDFSIQEKKDSPDRKDLQNDEEKLVERMDQIRLWEEDDGFLLAFNADNSTIRLLYKDLKYVPNTFKRYFLTLCK